MYPKKSVLNNLVLILSLAAGIALAFARSGLAGPPTPLSQVGRTTLEELERMPKIDAHAHVGHDGAADEKLFIDLLKKHNLKWLDICVVGTEWGKLQQRIATAESLHKRYPEQIAWATSFNLENWGQADWRKTALETIGQGFARGAVAVKVWKEIGMVLKDPDGHYVMIDDARFDPIFDYIESRNKTLVAHIGEPRIAGFPWNPWRSTATAATTRNIRNTMGFCTLRFPDTGSKSRPVTTSWKSIPASESWDAIWAAWNTMLTSWPSGLTSIPIWQWTWRARIGHLQAQDREKVRKFLIKYQDRLLYGTDNEIGETRSARKVQIKHLDKRLPERLSIFRDRPGDGSSPGSKQNFKVRGWRFRCPC